MRASLSVGRTWLWGGCNVTLNSQPDPWPRVCNEAVHFVVYAAWGINISNNVYVKHSNWCDRRHNKMANKFKLVVHLDHAPKPEGACSGMQTIKQHQDVEGTRYQRERERGRLLAGILNRTRVVTSTQRENTPYTSMLCGLFHLLCVSSQHLHNFRLRANSARSSEKRIIVFTRATYLLPTGYPNPFTICILIQLFAGHMTWPFHVPSEGQKAIFVALIKKVYEVYASKKNMRRSLFEVGPCWIIFIFGRPSSI